MKNHVKVEELNGAKNQYVIRCANGETMFQSYNSLIAIVDENGGLTLGKDWDYSQTTLKYLYAFLLDWCYKIWRNLDESKNKKQQIQKMIDGGEIVYNSEMK